MQYVLPIIILLFVLLNYCVNKCNLDFIENNSLFFKLKVMLITTTFKKVKTDSPLAF